MIVLKIIARWPVVALGLGLIIDPTLKRIGA